MAGNFWDNDEVVPAPAAPAATPGPPTEVEPVNVTTHRPFDMPVSTAGGDTRPGADLAMSLMTGLQQGVTALPGLMGDLTNGWGHGVDWAGEKAIGGLQDLTHNNLGMDYMGGNRPAGSAPVLPQFDYAHANGLATGSDWNKARQMVTGQDYQPKTLGGQYARTFGQFAPAAITGGGGVFPRLAQVAIPAMTSETAGQLTKGTPYEGFARFMGGLFGGGVAGLARPSTVDSAVGQVIQGQDPAALAARAQTYRSSGISPTLTDVVDDSGRAVVRAAASKMGPGRQAATDFRNARALDLPSRISNQARDIISSDPRTPDQIRADIAQQRGQAADAAFGAVRNDPIQMTPDMVEALRTDHGRAAIAEAASRERDPNIRGALNRLANDALDNPNTPITIGMADRVSRVLNGRAQAAARAGDPDLAGSLSGLGNAIRNPAKAASPGYSSALEDYGADTRLFNAAGLGENLLNHNTDEFVAGASNLTPEEQAVARAAARRAIERKSGENPASAPGVARQLADAPEQQARNAALLGPDAQRFQDAMRLEERLVQNANDIAPRSGSQSQLRAQDAIATAHGLLRLGGQAARHDWLGIGMDAMRGLYMRNPEGIVTTATDPRQLGAAIDAANRLRATSPLGSPALGRALGGMMTAAPFAGSAPIQPVPATKSDEWWMNDPTAQ